MRCQGLMYPLDPIYLLHGYERDRMRAWRCVICGNLVDPVILHNRIHQKTLRGPRRGRSPRQTVFKFADS